MLMTSLKARFTKSFALAFVTFAIALGGSIFAVTPAFAQHKMNENDMEVPTNNMEVVNMGRGMYAQRCAFCHGGDGHGGKGPCLACGKFSYTGNTNSEIYATIAAGIPQNRGGTMGAFGTSMTQEQILSVLTFLRWEETRRIKEGLIPDPYKAKGDDLPVFPKTN